MKNQTIKLFIPILIYSMILSSCGAIVDIFQAGMGLGIFLVVAVVALIIYFISRSGKSK